MTVSLKKKQTVSLTKNEGSLTQVRMGLGWDPAKSEGGFLSSIFGGGGGSIDLDASCLVLDENKNIIDTIWFRKLKSNDGSILHRGDNLTGDGDGDDEKIDVDLTRVSDAAKYLVFTVNSFSGQTFDKVANCYCRLLDQSDSSKEMARYDLAEKGSHTGVVLAYLTKTNGAWSMTAAGDTATGRTVNDMIPYAVKSIN